MDHFLDYLFLCSILIGYSFLVRDYNQYLLFFILALFGAFMVNSFLSFAATNEFKISYLGVGPTEVRLIFILVNGVLILSRDHMLAERALPYILAGSAFGLFVTVYRTQQQLWELDMRAKYGERRDDAAVQEAWALGISGWRLFRNMTLSLVLAAAALAVLMLGLFAPHHRFAALLVYLASWVPLALAFRNKTELLRLRGRQLKRRVRPYLLHAALAVVLLGILRAGFVLAPKGVEGHLSKVSTRDLAAELDVDAGSYRVLSGAMESLLAWFRGRELPQRAVVELSPQDRETVRAVWLDFVGTFRELQMLRDRYRGFYQIDYLAEPRMHARAFVLAYAAFVSQYRAALALCEEVDRTPFLAAFLDEADAGGTLSANSYSRMHARLTHPDELLRLNAGLVYLRLVGGLMADDPLVAGIRDDVEAIYAALDRRPSLFIENPIAVFEKKAFKAWFPIQKNVALQMSLTRAVHRENFIAKDRAAACRERLEPGDIILERRNWYMSNIGIPGFWPHAALYVGTPEQVSAFFADLPELGGREPISVLREQRAEAVEAYLRADEFGYPRCVIEAVRPGVVFTSLEVSGNADYLAVLRPRCGRSAKWQALLEAFSHYGKPYDYNFSFTTDNEFVCSELVWKSYQKAGGVDVSLQVVNGRPLVSPNQFAEIFARERGATNATFEFVLFLDGNEEEKTSIERDAEAFAATWARPKWDLAQD